MWNKARDTPATQKNKTHITSNVFKDFVFKAKVIKVKSKDLQKKQGRGQGLGIKANQHQGHTVQKICQQEANKFRPLTIINAASR